LNGLDLFTGIGGMSVALREWVRPIAYCEIDIFCQGILFSRMADKSIFNSPVWDDITTLQGSDFIGVCDIIYGGFPCQDISIAGHGKGLGGERSRLFFEIVRLAEEIKPHFIFLENVPAITTRGGLQVVSEIASLGYDCRWCVISAASVGALHKRERWFLLAYSSGEGSIGYAVGKEKEYSLFGNGCKNVADSMCERLEGFGIRAVSSSKKEPKTSSSRNDGNTDSQSGEQANTSTEPQQNKRRTWGGSSRQYWPFESREHWQEVVSGVCRTSDGVSFQLDRLRALGNAVCPQQTKKAFKILMGLE
jgi:DNA (cytosine-5)-methyltransferase 1